MYVHRMYRVQEGKFDQSLTRGEMNALEKLTEPFDEDSVLKYELAEALDTEKEFIGITLTRGYGVRKEVEEIGEVVEPPDYKITLRTDLDRECILIFVTLKEKLAVLSSKYSTTTEESRVYYAAAINWAPQMHVRIGNQVLLPDNINSFTIKQALTTYWRERVNHLIDELDTFSNTLDNRVRDVLEGKYVSTPTGF